MKLGIHYIAAGRTALAAANGAHGLKRKAAE